jgi:endonuclease
MKEMADELLKSPAAEFYREDAREWFAKKYPKVKWGTIVAHLSRLSVNSPSRVHYSAKEDDDVFFQMDQGRYRRYLPGVDPLPIRASDTTTVTSKLPEDDLPQQTVTGSEEFAYEKDLRNYLSKNLNLLEPGISLYEEEGIKGIEFPVGGRFIDILASDANGNLVVIELKVSRGYDRVIGQLLRYMAWIKKNLADEGTGVRGIIVAREISEDLVLSCSLVSNVELFEYKLSLTLAKIKVE